MWVRCTLGSLLVVLGSCLQVAASDSTEAAGDEVARLIEQLGAEQFATREKAQRKLQQLGLKAFDALLAAQEHDDVEISTRARFLLRGMPANWAQESDPPTVQSLLRNYSNQGRADRRSRMEHLARLPDSAGIEALARLSRFEPDRLLSKYAALQVLRHDISDEPARRAEIAGQIVAIVSTGNRPAALWLRAYATSFGPDGPPLDTWQRLIDAELEVHAANPRETSRSTLLSLLMWHAEQCYRIERQQDAESTTRRIIRSGLVSGDKPSMLTFINWAHSWDAAFAIEEIASRYDQQFYEHADLVYRLAEARLIAGDKESAEATAERAFKIAPTRARDHSLTARDLRGWGLFEWAEREYRHVLEIALANLDVSFEAAVSLGDLLFDLQREDEAANVLEKWLKQVEQHEKLSTAGLAIVRQKKATMHYYRAMHFGRAGDREKQREQLERAIENDPVEIDVIIAMFRYPQANDAWREKTRDRMDDALQGLDRRVVDGTQALETARSDIDRDDARYELGQAKNEWAWLVSNTEGDFQKAVAYSRHSLELVPSSYAYLDTLGRCYYAAGDYANAIRYQQQAIKHAPFVQGLKRQLKLFEDAQAKAE